MLTWTDAYTKAQRLSKDSSSDTLTQLKQDINTGYHLFNAKLSRYFSRKQQFTNLTAAQSIYQVPIDCVKVLGMTVSVNSTFQPTVKEIRSEYEWRQIVSVSYATTWPAYYFMLGNDEFQLFPTPSQTTTNGLRFYYQPQDHDLSIDDTTSTSAGVTATLTNGSATVTLSGSVLTANTLQGLQFHQTGVADLTWYEIVSNTATTVTLKSAFVGVSGSGQAWRIGQTFITPQEYHDAPIHYALGNYFSAQGNESRAAFHLGTADKPGMFYQMVEDCREEYSSSNVSSVITSDDLYINPFTIPPVPGV